MRTLQAGSSDVPARGQHGFTLVEVLVTLAIIALVSAAVIFTVPGGKPKVVAQSDALLSALNRAAQNAIITGEPNAFGASSSSHAFYRFTNGEWVMTEQTQWPSGVTAALVREARPIDLTDALLPLITFEATGLSTPFMLSLSGEEGRMQLRSSGDGRVRLEG